MAIQKVPLVGPKTVRELMAHCGSAEAIFKTKKEKLLKIPNVGLKVAENIAAFKDFSTLEKEWAFAEKNDIRVLSYLDKNYPQRLKHFDESPVVLYAKGNANLNPNRTVGIVGTRKATAKGRAICEALVEGLQEYGVTVMSGLAYGIDVTAHRKCVDLGVPTVGVLAHGLDRIYPHAHQSVAKAMLEEGGLITEFSSGTTPDRQNFPSRNRIIAGMSDALIVVETKVSGGSVITANKANEYNKDVFAVPGRLNDEFSQGCNRLIKIHKAALLESAADIGYIMRWEKQDEETAAIQRNLFVDLSEEEEKIVAILRQSEEIGIDKLSFDLKMTTGRLAGLMLEMEFKGLVRPMPGSRYVLVK